MSLQESVKSMSAPIPPHRGCVLQTCHSVLVSQSFCELTQQLFPSMEVLGYLLLIVTDSDKGLKHHHQGSLVAPLYLSASRNLRTFL
jgi:hypothetical protein